MKTLFNKFAAKTTLKAMELKNTAIEAMENNDGMEVVQVLIIVIISVTLGALLLTTLKTEFGSLLGKVSTEMNAMFA